ncbi:hypothetical protein ACTFIV_001123 [Dictyostelium citrinum]
MNILKNKYLFKKIFYFVKYDRPNLISIYSILKESDKDQNLMIELLKEKILNNQYLIFTTPKGFKSLLYYSDNVNNEVNSNGGEDDPSNAIQLLIEVYKNENQSFFKSLFSNYSLYFITKPNNNNEKKQFDKLVWLILKYKSKSALEVLIKYHGFKPNIETFNTSLLVNSSKQIVDLILSYLNPKENEEIKSKKIWEQILKDTVVKFKLLNHLNEDFKNYNNNNNNINNNYNNNNNKDENYENIEHSIGLPNYYRDPYDQLNLIERGPFLSLSRFISICKYMVLHPNLSSSITPLPPQSTPTIEELKNIKSQFTKSELKSTLPYLFSINQVYKENEFIKKLYKFYIDYNNESSLKYNIIYNVDNFDLKKEKAQVSIEFGNGLKSIKSLFNLCLDYGNYRFLNQWFNEKNIDSSLNEETTLFSHCCEKDKKKKLDFIMNVHNFNPLVLFLLLVKYDDIEILSNYVDRIKTNNNSNGIGDHQHLKPRKTTYSDKFQYYTFSYINSIEMLEYLFNNGFKNHFIDPIISKTSLLYHRGRIDLLEKFKELLLLDTNIKSDSILINRLFTKVENNLIVKIPLTVINYMVNESSGLYNSKFNFNNLETWLCQVNTDSDLQIIKHLINRSPLIENLTYSYRITLITNQKYQIKLFNWIYENRNDDIYKTGICALSIIQFCNFLFLTNRFDQLFKIEFFLEMVNGNQINSNDYDIQLLNYFKQQNGGVYNSSFEIKNIVRNDGNEIHLISKYAGTLEDGGTIKFLQKLIQYYSPLLENDPSLSKYPKVQTFLFNVLQSYANHGRIEIFTYLNSNYTKILSEWLLNINLNIITHRYLKHFLSKISI